MGHLHLHHDCGCDGDSQAPHFAISVRGRAHHHADRRLSRRFCTSDGRQRAGRYRAQYVRRGRLGLHEHFRLFQRFGQCNAHLHARYRRRFGANERAEQIVGSDRAAALRGADQRYYRVQSALQLPDDCVSGFRHQIRRRAERLCATQHRSRIAARGRRGQRAPVRFATRHAYLGGPRQTEKLQPVVQRYQHRHPGAKRAIVGGCTRQHAQCERTANHRYRVGGRSAENPRRIRQHLPETKHQRCQCLPERRGRNQTGQPRL